MPQNANTAPSATVEQAAAPPRAAVGLGGRSAVEAARSVRRATRLPAAPIAAAEPVVDAVTVVQVEAEAPPAETPTPEAPQTGAPLARARRWQPTRGRRQAATLPPLAPAAEPSANASTSAPMPEAPPTPDDGDTESSAGLVDRSDLSVFEHLVRGSVAPPSEPAAADVPPPEPSAEPLEAAPVAAEPDTTPDMEIVAELGPGLRLRLRQLGFGTDAALAAAHPDQLRQGLGEISRMLNVEAWIDDARRREAAAQAASDS